MKLSVKKIFLIFVLSVITLSLSAQHMSFMGIPIGTHINTFRQSILSKGFKPFSSRDAAPNIYCFNGTFSGYRVTLNVQVTPKTKKVYSVYTVFTDFFYFKSGYNPRYGSGVSMKDITNVFNDLSAKLTKKYGNYYNYNPSDPQYLKWHIWHCKGGSIGLVIANYNDAPNCVKMFIDYSDEATERLRKQEEYDDI